MFTMNTTNSSRSRAALLVSKNARRGFTLVEIMLVVIAIGILVAMLMPRFGNVVGATTTNSTANDKAVCNRILEAFDAAGGTYQAGATAAANKFRYGTAAQLYADLLTGATVTNGGVSFTYGLPSTAPASPSWLSTATVVASGAGYRLN
jgi:prepilin-type N-terminal cleavage/methylation domain-containing protein